MAQIPKRRFNLDGLNLSPAMEDYLKAVFSLSRQRDTVSTQAIADRLGFSPASVTKMVKKLAEAKLLNYEKYQGVSLTEPGRKIAVEILRHHRLLELYLTQALGYSWDEVHEEAELLEHFISEKLEARICAFLGDPDFDPHGAPIPTLDGDLPGQSDRLLSKADIYRAQIVTRVSEMDASVLQELEGLGLVPGASVCVLGRPPGGRVHLKVGRKEHLVSPDVCANIRCTPEEKLTFTAGQIQDGETATLVKIRAKARSRCHAIGLVKGAKLTRRGQTLEFDGQELALLPELTESLIVEVETGFGEPGTKP